MTATMAKNRAQLAAEAAIGEEMTECVVRLIHGVTLSKAQVDRIIEELNKCLGGEYAGIESGPVRE